MSGVIVKREVILRSVVTEALKKQLQDDLQQAAEEIDQRLAQVDFQMKPYLTDLQRTNLQQAMQVRKQVEAEKQKQQDLRDALLKRKEEVAGLALDSEVVRGTLESFVEVNLGDDLSALLGGIEVVTKDDLVVDIRQHKSDEVAEESTPIFSTSVPSVE